MYCNARGLFVTPKQSGPASAATDRDRGPTVEESNRDERTCLSCGVGIAHRRAGARFCGNQCYVRWNRANPSTTAACKVEGCDRTDVVIRSGYCGPHHRRWLRNGDPGDAYVQAPRGAQARPTLPTCEVDGCDRPARCRNYCHSHRRLQLVNGDPLLRRNPGVPAGKGLSGPDHHAWKDGSAEYVAVHHRLRRVFGEARNHTCVDCGLTAENWSYMHGAPEERHSPGGQPYTLDLSYYEPRCVRCHHWFDRGFSERWG